MTAAFTFSGRCVVVTGAGRGIGRAYALELARRGASVIVNDVSPEPANDVADEIKAAGGAALAVVADAVDAAASRELVGRACKTFGGVDAVIANASINGKRKRFPELTLADLHAMLDVNVFGAWSLLQAAWPHLSTHGRGRVLLTTSQAALYGMPTLAEYALAKGALIGLMRTLAHEGAAVGITVNAIAPAAATRITEETVRDERALDMLRVLQPPALVAPMATVLVHDSCSVSGEIFVAGGAHAGRVFIGETKGVTLPQSDFTAEAVYEQFEAIRDESGYRVPRDISETGDPAQKAEIFKRLGALGLVSAPNPEGER
jgi:NAD(P)-dependent dehydrogenase (short-subunit alcohol dehydrogenase family)